MKVQIRKSSQKDISELSELFRQEIEYQQHMASYYELQPDFDWIAYTHEKLRRSNGCVLVADSGTVLSGFIDIRIVDYNPYKRNGLILMRILRPEKKASLPIKPLRFGIIEDCYVVPSFRRQGIGSQLVVSAKKWFQSQDITRIELSMIVSNKEGDVFWNKMGYDVFRLLLFRKI